MTRPTLVVELGLGSTWQTEPASITWTDVSAYVLDRDLVSMMRGASAARGQVDAGSAGMSLKNIDRRFESTYTAGPYYGNLKPGTPIRVQAYTSDADTLTWGGEELTWGGEALVWGSVIPVWYGSVKKWPQRYDIGNTFAWVPVECWDGFADLARAKIPRSVLEAELLADSPLAYFPMTEQAGEAMLDDSGNDHDGGYAQDDATSRRTTITTADGVAYDVLDFDGSSDSAFAQVILNTRPLVVEALVSLADLPDGSTGRYTILASGDGGSTWLRLEAFDGAGTHPHGIVGYLSSMASYAIDTDVDPSEPLWVSLRIPASGDPVLYLNGVDVTSITGTLPTSALPSGTRIGSLKGRENFWTGPLVHVVMYDTDVSATRIAAHSDAAITDLADQTTDERIGWVLDHIDWPTNLRDLEVGDQTLGPAGFLPAETALDYFRQLAASEDGTVFCGKDGKLRLLNRYWRYLDTLATTSQITFSDQNTGRGYAQFDLDLDDELLVNVARFTRRGGEQQVAEDAASVAEYGEAEKSLTGLLQRSDGEVRALAEWTVATQSTPLPRVPTIRIPLHDYSAADQALVLGLDLGHRVTCNRTPQGVGTAIALNFLVDGIRHEVNATEWWTTLFVSPVPQDTVGLLIWDTGAWDDADAVWAY